MEIATCKTETIIINNPSEKLKALMKKVRAHKMQRREQMRNIVPMFTVTLS